IGKACARSMRFFVRFTTACISGFDSDAFMKSFCMSCNTKAVFDRPIGGNGAPFITTPFSVYTKEQRKNLKYQYRIRNTKRGHSDFWLSARVEFTRHKHTSD